MFISDVGQSGSVIHIHVSILSQILFLVRLLQDIEKSSLCCTVGPCWLELSTFHSFCVRYSEVSSLNYMLVPVSFLRFFYQSNIILLTKTYLLSHSHTTFCFTEIIAFKHSYLIFIILTSTFQIICRYCYCPIHQFSALLIGFKRDEILVHVYLILQLIDPVWSLNFDLNHFQCFS